MITKKFQDATLAFVKDSRSATSPSELREIVAEALATEYRRVMDKVSKGLYLEIDAIMEEAQKMIQP